MTETEIPGKWYSFRCYFLGLRKTMEKGSEMKDELYYLNKYNNFQNGFNKL